MHWCISYSKLSLLNYLQMKSLGNFSVQDRFSFTFLSMRNFLLALISIYLEQLSFFESFFQGAESFPWKSFSKNRFIYTNVDIGVALYLVKNWQRESNILYPSKLLGILFRNWTFQTSFFRKKERSRYKGPLIRASTGVPCMTFLFHSN